MKQLILFFELRKTDQKIQYVVGENAKDLTTFRIYNFCKLHEKLSDQVSFVKSGLFNQYCFP